MKTERTKKSTHELIEPHIIRMRVRDGEDVEIEDVMQMHEANAKLTGGKPFAVLLDVKNHFNVSKEARELIASERFAEHLLASAFVVRTLAAKLTGNFYLHFNRPHNPTRLF